MSEIDHKYTREITCPHCGHALSDSWEFADEGREICDACGEKFSFERDVEVTYSTAKLKREAPRMGQDDPQHV